MEVKLKEEIKILIHAIKDAGVKWEFVATVEGKDKSGYFINKGYYDPWYLEPIHIAYKLGITLIQLEKQILEEEDEELIIIWEDYKLFGKLVMLYDERFKNIIPQLSEFTLNKFNKEDLTKTDVIIKIPKANDVAKNVEISRLQKELEFYKKEGK